MFGFPEDLGRLVIHQTNENAEANDNDNINSHEKKNERKRNTVTGAAPNAQQEGYAFKHYDVGQCEMTHGDEDDDAYVALVEASAEEDDGRKRTRRRRRGRQPRPSLLTKRVIDAIEAFAAQVGQPRVIEPAGFRDFRGWLTFLNSRSARPLWAPIIQAALEEARMSRGADEDRSGDGDGMVVVDDGLKGDIVRAIVRVVVVPRHGESCKLVSTNCGRQCARPSNGAVTLMTVLDQLFDSFQNVGGTNGSSGSGGRGGGKGRGEPNENRCGFGQFGGGDPCGMGYGEGWKLGVKLRMEEARLRESAPVLDWRQSDWDRQGTKRSRRGSLVHAPADFSFPFTLTSDGDDNDHDIENENGNDTYSDSDVDHHNNHDNDGDNHTVGDEGGESLRKRTTLSVREGAYRQQRQQLERSVKRRRRMTVMEPTTQPAASSLSRAVPTTRLEQACAQGEQEKGDLERQQSRLRKADMVGSDSRRATKTAMVGTVATAAATATTSADTSDAWSPRIKNASCSPHSSSLTPPRHPVVHTMDLHTAFHTPTPAPPTTTMTTNTDTNTTSTNTISTTATTATTTISTAAPHEPHVQQRQRELLQCQAAPRSVNKGGLQHTRSMHAGTARKCNSISLLCEPVHEREQVAPRSNTEAHHDDAPTSPRMVLGGEQCRGSQDFQDGGRARVQATIQKREGCAKLPSFRELEQSLAGCTSRSRRPVSSIFVT